jgi:prevent-host-death family protein
MKTIEKTDATASLASYAEHAEDFPIVITDHGRPIAALMPVPNADAETVSLSSNPEFLSLISRSRARQTSEGGLSTQEMRRRLGK